MTQHITRKTLNITMLAAGVSLLPIISHAEPKVTTLYENYKISGNNINELKSAIKFNAPRTKDGNKFAATTKYDIFWNYTYDKTGPGCKIASIDTEVVLTYKMPEIENISNLSVEHEAQWKEYYAALKLHEDGHAQRGIEAATEIENTVINMKPRQNCQILGNDANKLSKEIIKKYHDENLSYDEYTKHGKEQGVFLTANPS